MLKFKYLEYEATYIQSLIKYVVVESKDHDLKKLLFKFKNIFDGTPESNYKELKNYSKNPEEIFDSFVKRQLCRISNDEKEIDTLLDTIFKELKIPVPTISMYICNPILTNSRYVIEFRSGFFEVPNYKKLRHKKLQFAGPLDSVPKLKNREFPTMFKIVNFIYDKIKFPVLICFLSYKQEDPLISKTHSFLNSL